MPIIYGEPTGTLRQTSAPQVLGPFTFVGNLAANTSTQSVAPMTTGSKHNNLPFNATFAPLRLRGFTGYINVNALSAANTLTFTVGAAASSYGGTEAPASLAATALVVQGGYVGPIRFAPAAPMGLPSVANPITFQGCVLGLFVLGTAGGAVDIATYLHLEP